MPLFLRGFALQSALIPDCWGQPGNETERAMLIAIVKAQTRDHHASSNGKRRMKHIAGRRPFIALPASNVLR
jgi:hypothetical protein